MATRISRFRLSVGLALASLCGQACGLIDPAGAGNLVPATVDDDPTLPFMDVNGTRLHAETHGDPSARAIVFLHGGPGDDYRGLLRLAALADDYFLVFFDQRGSGLSRREGEEEISWQLYLRDLDAIAERCSPGGPVILVGHSWGGMYATGYAAFRPARVSHVVLIDSGPLKASMEAFMPGGGLRPGDPAANELAFLRDQVSPDDHVRADFAILAGAGNKSEYAMSETDPMPLWRRGAFAALWLVAEGMDEDLKPIYDFTTGLDAFAGPALFIAGELDRRCGTRLQEAQLGAYPNALPSVLVIPGAGHDVVWAKPDAVIAGIRAFLANY